MFEQKKPADSILVIGGVVFKGRLTLLAKCYN